MSKSVSERKSAATSGRAKNRKMAPSAGESSSQAARFSALEPRRSSRWASALNAAPLPRTDTDGNTDGDTDSGERSFVRLPIEHPAPLFEHAVAVRAEGGAGRVETAAAAHHLLGALRHAVGDALPLRHLRRRGGAPELEEEGLRLRILPEPGELPRRRPARQVPGELVE